MDALGKHINERIEALGVEVKYVAAFYWSNGHPVASKPLHYDTYAEAEAEAHRGLAGDMYAKVEKRYVKRAE